MKRRLAALAFPVALAVSAWAPPAHAQSADPDPWLGPDKRTHFLASAALTTGGYALSSLISDNVAVRIAFGAGLSLAAGTGKELIDLTGAGDPSWKDFTWDVIGTAAGIGLSVAFDFATRSHFTCAPVTAPGAH